MLGTYRQKVFGVGPAVAMDRNQKCRVSVYIRAMATRHRHERVENPVTRAAVEVGHILLWQFHNARSGVCFPSYITIARAAHCGRSTVARALRALEAAGVISWAHRLIRIREPRRNGSGERSRLIRISNSYWFADPKQPPAGIRSESVFRSGTLNQELKITRIEPSASQAAARAALDAIAGRRQLEFETKWLMNRSAGAGDTES